MNNETFSENMEPKSSPEPSQPRSGFTLQHALVWTLVAAVVSAIVGGFPLQDSLLLLGALPAIAYGFWRGRQFQPVFGMLLGFFISCSVSFPLNIVAPDLGRGLLCVFSASLVSAAIPLEIGFESCWENAPFTYWIDAFAILFSVLLLASLLPVWVRVEEGLFGRISYYQEDFWSHFSVKPWEEVVENWKSRYDEL